MTPDSQQLQILPAGAGRPLNRDQKRFNTLIAEIEQARATLQAWRDNAAVYRKAYVERLVPLQARFRTALRQWALALDAAAGERWPRGERQLLSEMIAAAAAELLAHDEGDTKARDLFERHGGIDDEAGRELQERPEVAAEPEQRARPERAGKSAAQQRREELAKRTTQSLREVFRKLASALHPDRETDPVQRAAKTKLMAQVNEAYGREDLLALLELQLRIEQIDAAHLANVDAVRLKHYNKVLAEQLAELRDEIAGVEMDFHADFGLEPGTGLDPKRLGKVLEAEAARLRSAVAQFKQEAGGFRDPGWTRSWLKAQRRYMAE